MKKIREYKNFQKDTRLLAKRGNNLDKMTTIITLLQESKELPHNAKPQNVIQNYLQNI